MPPCKLLQQSSFNHWELQSFPEKNRTLLWVRTRKKSEYLIALSRNLLTWSGVRWDSVQTSIFDGLNNRSDLVLGLKLGCTRDP